MTVWATVGRGRNENILTLSINLFGFEEFKLRKNWREHLKVKRTSRWWNYTYFQTRNMTKNVHDTLFRKHPIIIKKYLIAVGKDSNPDRWGFVETLLNQFVYNCLFAGEQVSILPTIFALFHARYTVTSARLAFKCICACQWFSSKYWTYLQNDFLIHLLVAQKSCL